MKMPAPATPLHASLQSLGKWGEVMRFPGFLTPSPGAPEPPCYFPLAFPFHGYNTDWGGHWLGEPVPPGIPQPQTSPVLATLCRQHCYLLDGSLP